MELENKKKKKQPNKPFPKKKEENKFDNVMKELQVDLGNLEEMLGKRFDQVMQLVTTNTSENGVFIAQATHRALI